MIPLGLEDEKYLRTGALRRKLGVPETPCSPRLLRQRTGGGWDFYGITAPETGREKLFAAAMAECTPVLKEKVSALVLKTVSFLPPGQAARGEVLAEADVFFGA